jgi:hypothetical protein
MVITAFTVATRKRATRKQQLQEEVRDPYSCEERVPGILHPERLAEDALAHPDHRVLPRVEVHVRCCRGRTHVLCAGRSSGGRAYTANDGPGISVIERGPTRSASVPCVSSAAGREAQEGCVLCRIVSFWAASRAENEHVKFGRASGRCWRYCTFVQYLTLPLAPPSYTQCISADGLAG